MGVLSSLGLLFPGSHTPVLYCPTHDAFLAVCCCTVLPHSSRYGLGLGIPELRSHPALREPLCSFPTRRESCLCSLRSGRACAGPLDTSFGISCPRLHCTAVLLPARRHLSSLTALPSSHRLNLRLSFCDFYSPRANPVGTLLSRSLALTLKKRVRNNSWTKRGKNKFVFFYCCVFHCGFQKLIAERSRATLPGTECEFLTSRDGSGNIY